MDGMMTNEMLPKMIERVVALFLKLISESMGWFIRIDYGVAIELRHKTLDAPFQFEHIAKGIRVMAVIGSDPGTV